MATVAEKIEKVANWMLSNNYSVIPISKQNKSPSIKWKEFIDKPIKLQAESLYTQDQYDIVPV